MSKQTVTSKKQKGALSRVLRYVMRYPISLAGTLLFSIITVAATLCVPVFFGDAVDCIVEFGVQWEQLKAVFFKVVLAVGIAALSQWLLSLCNNRISCNCRCIYRRCK